MRLLEVGSLGLDGLELYQGCWAGFACVKGVGWVNGTVGLVFVEIFFSSLF